MYEEYITLIDGLKAMTREERFELYERMTKTLYPHAKKTVDLEDQLNEERKDYQRKFKEWFFVICNWTFGSAHFGETCFDLFKKEVVKKSKKDKQSSKIYAHKVILALGLMGYFESVKENYSHSTKGSHGYNYRVDMFKWVELAMSVPRGNVSVSLDVDIDWSGYEDWYGERQYETITSMSVEPQIYEQAKTYLESLAVSSKGQYKQQYSVAKCLKCGLCLEVCPNYRPGGEFFGAVLANESYLTVSQAAEDNQQMIKEYKTHFGAGCSKALSCQSVCPMEIETITSIMRMNRK